MKREGLGYVGFRLVEAVREALDGFANRVVSQEEVDQAIRRAFPDRPFHLQDLHRLFHIPIHEVGNLNSQLAAETLRSLRADLGIVLGTRVLKRSTFSVPRLGCLNVHKGKVPEYRGLPPGFWELYDGQSAAGVTIHFVDDGLDTGDIVGAGSVPIHPADSVETLQVKLDALAKELLVQSVTGIAQESYTRTKQPAWSGKARTSPTRAQRRELEHRCHPGKGRMNPIVSGVKTAVSLAMYFGGFVWLIRTVRKVLGIQRACVILYHRVNDECDDPMTASLERFAQHVVLLKRSYEVIDSSELVRRLQTGKQLSDRAIVVHFDDCYRDVFTSAFPLLKQAGLPASVFVSTGFVGTSRIFDHDRTTCPLPLENFTADDLCILRKSGWEIGSHTVNHADLGKATEEEARYEIGQSKTDLETILKEPITLFSYPFGGRHHTQPIIRELVQQAGYAAMFSAYAGYVHQGADLYNIQRISVSGHFRPLDLIMEIEGLSFGALTRRLSQFVGRTPT
jgi:peptidoglycan/xylan/chitin deacetylase (PgdA/CDA1 family)